MKRNGDSWKIQEGNDLFLLAHLSEKDDVF